jgi:two-component sensor histidine kinase
VKAISHPRQEERLAVLKSYGVLDTPREADFDEIVALASAICETPISVVNIIDADRQFFKAEVGLGVRETPLDSSLCAHAILESEYLEIPDTLTDARMCDNPLCLAEDGLRFYAGALLRTSGGLPIGTLCVLDTKPRRLTSLQVQTLKTLSHQVMMQLELRLALARQQVLLKESDHRVKNSLQSIGSMLNASASRANNSDVRLALRQASERVANVALLHQQLYGSETNDTVDAAVYVQGLINLLSATVSSDVVISAKCEPLLLNARQATAIGVIVTEFTLNSIKHAFIEGAGSIVVEFKREANGLVTLTCKDDGPGMPAHGSPRSGLGLRIMDASAGNLGGTLETIPSVLGHSIKLTFAL